MQTKHLRFGISGFTLIEIIIVVSILAILATVVGINYSDSSRKARDAERQADLRSLQNAIELYKNRVGRYPAGCAVPAAANGWSGQLGTNYACSDGTGQYIVGLAPTYINVLPVDPKLNGTNSGYVYRTDGNGTTYKLMAMRTVESETVTYAHKFSSCYVDPLNEGDLDIEISGYCARARFAGPGLPPWCDKNDPRFQTSYGLWGGIAPLFPIGVHQSLPTGSTAADYNEKISRIRLTTDVICQ